MRPGEDEVEEMEVDTSAVEIEAETAPEEEIEEDEDLIEVQDANETALYDEQ